MPDAQFTLDHVTAQGDSVVVESTGRGTNTGDFVLPAGTLPASARGYADSGAIMAQLGITEKVGLKL